MRTRLLLVCLLQLPLPVLGHQGGNHPTGATKCEDVYDAISWWHLYGTGVQSTGSQSPFQPQEYLITNDQEPGKMPRATVKIAWAMGEGHLNNYSDFYKVITIGNSRVYATGGTATDQYVINPLIDGWRGTMTVHYQHKTCAFSMSATAHWDFKRPDEPDCRKCTELTCEGRAEIGSVDVAIPVGSVRNGEEAVEIGYKSEQLANEGQATLAVLGPIDPEGGAIVTKVDGILQSVQCGTHLARVLPDPSPENPQRLRIVVSHDKDNPDLTIYREAVLESTAGPDPVFRYTDTAGGRTSIREFSNPDPDTWILIESDLRRTTRTLLSDSITTRTHRFTVEERDAAGAWGIVSQRDETETEHTWGWVLTERVLDPLGAALTTTWDYYDAPEFSGPNADVTGRGRLQSVSFPTGLVRSHEYHDTDPLDPAFDRLQITTEAFAGTPGAKELRVHTSSDATSLNQLRERFLDSHLVDRTEVEVFSNGGSTNYRIETRYPSDGGDPEVTRHDFDNTRSRLFNRTIYPDGTAEVVHVHLPSGLHTTTVFRGLYNPANELLPIHTGTFETTVRSDLGQVLESSRGRVRNGVSVPAEQRHASAFDVLERPLAYEVFHGTAAAPTYTETLEYGCCGVSQRTGEDGIPVHTFYDALGRLVKSHRDGLASETVYDGQTTRAHLYPEAVPSGLSLATADTETGFTTLDLAGQVVAEATRSPQDNSLVTTTTETIYAPGPGLGLRRVQTAPPTADDLGMPAAVTTDFYLDGLLASVRGPLVADVLHTYTANPAGLLQTTARLDAASLPFEAIAIQHDWLGRAISKTYAGDADGDGEPDRSLTSYDAGGRPVRHSDPDGVTTLFAYDLLDETSTVALDLDGDGAITPGPDEVRLTRRGQFLNPSGELILWSEDVVHDEAGLPQVLQRQESRSDGREEWNYTYEDGVPALTHTLTASGLPGAWDTVSDLPDGSFVIQRFRNARLDADESRDATGTTLATRRYIYDAYRRITAITDTSGPTLQTAYLSPHLDLPARHTLGGRITDYTYDHRGRTNSIDEPDTIDHTGAPVDNVRHTAWFPHGAVREVTGTPGHHLEYTYDDAHRLSTLTTHGTGDTVTRWLYDPDRGWPVAKLHDSPNPATGSGPSFTYTAAGRLASRLSARGIATSHSYGPDGRRLQTTYSDGTPAVTILERDRRGRITRLSDAGGERTLAYHDSGTLRSTAHEPGHLLSGWSVGQERDSLGRLTSLHLNDGSIDQYHAGYTYDPAGRLNSVEANNLAAFHHYSPSTLRLSQLSISSPSGPLLFSTRTYDELNRLTRINHHNGDPFGDFVVHSDHHSERDALGRLTSVTRTDRTQWRYEYDAAGQLATAARHLDSESSEVLGGHHFAWSYDGIGNRTSSSRGDPPAPATYTPNPLNQYSAVQSPGLAEVFGEAPLGSEVLVNGAPAARQGPFFHHLLSADNSGGPLRLPITIENGGDTASGHLSIPSANHAPTHDADGNLFTNGFWNFTWDAENRLTQAESTTAALAAGFPYQRLTYLYDAESRRIQRLRHDAPAPAPPVETTRFLHAGWRCLGELDAANQLTRTLTWGLDGHHALHLGDGNGALLWLHDLPSAQTHLAQHDGHGNLTGLLSAQTKLPTAHYQYSPFGQLLAATGPYALQNPYRFSTQFHDPATGLIYYGHRHLDPTTGRWLSREPLGESESPNLYAFLANDPVNNYDALGLAGNAGFWAELNSTASNFLQITAESLRRVQDDVAHAAASSASDVAVVGGRFYGRIGTGLVNSRTALGTALGNELAAITNSFRDPMFADEYARTLDDRLRELRKGGGEIAELADRLLFDPEYRKIALCYAKSAFIDQFDSWDDWEEFLANLNIAFLEAAVGSRVPQLRGLGQLRGPVHRSSPTRWGPHTGAGPLGAEVAGTFRGGSYTEIRISEPTTLYRVHGGRAGELGSYWTRIEPTGSIQSRIDSALLPQWGNTATEVSVIRVPQGTTIFEGAAAPQGNLLGGGNQVFIPEVSAAWLVR